MTETPEWYRVLGELATDERVRSNVAAALTDALAYVDTLRKSYSEAWAPVELPWRRTRPGDAFVGKGGSLWRITNSAAGVGAEAGQWRLDVARAGEKPTAYLGDGDELVAVLCPVAERDAFVLLRNELGAQPIGRAAA